MGNFVSHPFDTVQQFLHERLCWFGDRLQIPCAHKVTPLTYAARCASTAPAGRRKLIAKSMSRRVPYPVAPFGRHDWSVSAFIGPAMSMCAHGTFPTNSDKKSAAVM